MRKSENDSMFLRTGNYLNPFSVNVPILYPLKTPENQKFFGVFRGYKMGTLAIIELNDLQSDLYSSR